MSPERQVYLLDPQELSPEIIAVAFAKTSRSPESFREIAAELTEEKSAAFHERWVVGYGHASVAEHAVLHIAVENVSRLAVETLESNRLASYTEKSTRYQKWGPADFYVPPELHNHPLLEDYLTACRRLFEAYQTALPAVQAVIAAQTPRQANETEAAYERRIRSDYVDVCRFFLPAASLANVGITINARALEHAIRKMLSHPLEEVRQLGEEMKRVAQQEVPTLIKYADAVPYLVQTRQSLTHLAPGQHQPEIAGPDWCRLVHFDPAGEDRLLASALFRFNHDSYEQNLVRVRQMSASERQQLAYTLLGTAGKFDIPLRELEHSSFTFEVTLDQGGYFELKRHRMMTQTAQPLTTWLGYALPRPILAAGLEGAFRTAMDQASESFEKLAAFNPEVAAYIVPNAFNRRVLLTFNLRCADHFVSLRSAPNAHFSIRRVAHRMAQEIRQAVPLLGSYLREAPGETWQQVEENYFA
jgi:thymidylate synthase ThyX